MFFLSYASKGMPPLFFLAVQCNFDNFCNLFRSLTLSMTSVRLTALDVVKGHFYGVAHSVHIEESLNLLNSTGYVMHQQV
jgi:hypothetical protein